MIRSPASCTRTCTLFPYTTLFRCRTVRIDGLVTGAGEGQDAGGDLVGHTQHVQGLFIANGGGAADDGANADLTAFDTDTDRASLRAVGQILQTASIAVLVASARIQRLLGVPATELNLRTLADVVGEVHPALTSPNTFIRWKN